MSAEPLLRLEDVTRTYPMGGGELAAAFADDETFPLAAIHELHSEP